MKIAQKNIIKQDLFIINRGQTQNLVTGGRGIQHFGHSRTMKSMSYIM